ncbi:SAF domain-containing protein [Cellulomonas sp. McL0617]|uniref:SAF domain-containing protein n=1 Tax=Cellulomonas sp. McL0617 TaxID=3415675 RepID=UPI003CF5D00D
MTTTSDKPKLNGRQAAPELRPAALVRPRGRRRPGFVVAGVAMAALGALVVMWLVSATGHRTDVVMMARDVDYGSTITAADLTTTAVSADPGVTLVAADDAPILVGKVAVAKLGRGTLLTPGDVAASGVLGADEVMVPLPLAAERIPAGGLAAGTQLLVVDTPAQGADPVTGVPATFQVRVVRVGAPDVNGLEVADAVAAAADGPALAMRAATGRFAIVVEPSQATS